MNKKNKVVLTSAATIAMCACVSVGGTFALFTSESSVDISVTSGKVAVSASVNDFTLYSYGTEGAVTSFTNGGTATYDVETNQVTLDRITPGDKVTFNIVVENESNVHMQYRIVSQVASDNGLYGGLVVTMQSDAVNSVSGSALSWTPWKGVGPQGDGAEVLETVAVCVELPYLQEDQNQYQDKNCSLSFTVEAVQGNAEVADDTLTFAEGFEVIKTQEGEIVLTSVPTVAANGVVEVPVGVTDVGGAFTYNSEIKKVVLPETVTTISNNAFAMCESLTEVVIPESVTSIGQGAFASCSSLETIAVPQGITTIAQGTFQGCTSLETVELKGAVTSIGGQAFMDCSALTEIDFPETVTTIGDQTFQNCTSLSSVELSDDLTKISQSAFYNCTSLTQVELPDSLTTLERGAFQKTGLTSVEVPTSVTSMANYTFYECANLTQFVLAEDSTVNLKDYVITGTQVSEVVIPEGVTLSEHTFRNMKNLSRVVFKGEVASIPDFCFAGLNDSVHLTLVFEKNTALPTFKQNKTLSPNGTNVFRSRSEVTVIMPNYTGTETSVKVGYEWTYQGELIDCWTTLTIKTSEN